MTSQNDLKRDSLKIGFVPSHITEAGRSLKRPDLVKAPAVEANRWVAYLPNQGSLDMRVLKLPYIEVE